MMANSGFSNDAKNIQASIAAIAIPASGVHKPKNRSIPATDPNRYGRLDGKLVV